MADKVSIDDKVSKDLESVADAVFSGTAVEGFESMVAPGSTPAATIEAPATDTDTDPAAPTAGAEPAAAEPDVAEPEEGTPAAAEDTAPDAVVLATDAEKKAAELAAAAVPLPVEEQEIPVDIKGKTRERMETLVSRVKEKNTEIQATTEKLELANTQVAAFQKIIEDSGLADDEFIHMIDLGTDIKRNPERAFGVLQGVLKSLAKDLGKKIESVDLLDGYPDLQDRVAKMDLSAEDAEALANSRRQSARAERLKTEQDNTTRSAEATKTAIVTAATQVQKFLQTKEKSVDYAKMAPLLTTAAKFASENLDPSKWLAYISDQYTRIEAAAALGTPKGRAEEPSPLTDKGVPGSKQKEVSTLEDLTESLL